MLAQCGPVSPHSALLVTIPKNGAKLFFLKSIFITENILNRLFMIQSMSLSSIRQRICVMRFPNMVLQYCPNARTVSAQSDSCAAEQFVELERRKPASQLAWCGEG